VKENVVKLRACLVIAALGAVAGCGNKDRSQGKRAAPPLAAKQDKDIPEGLDLRLSDGKQGAGAYDASKLAPARKLGDAEVQQLLSRAQPLAAQPDDQQAFALRPASQPAPRTGETIKQSFPPPASSLLPPAASNAGDKLQVVRYMPEGEVEIAPELTVTFNKPMVAVTSQEDAAKTTPVKLTPQPKGRWRWIGTRTIVFDPDVRFPQATTYKVEVPATGTTFTFETPGVKLQKYWPSGGAPQQLDVPMFLELDQKVDPRALASLIKVRTSVPMKGGDPWGNGAASTVPFRLLDAREIAANKELKLFADAAKKAEHDGRWIAIRTISKLPADATVTVEIPEGTPSLEGPNKTKAAQTFSFHTYPPLRIDRTYCASASEECGPGTPLTFYFNNPIDVAKFDPKLVKVQPAVADMKVIASGRAVAVIGDTRARTTYTVTVGGGLLDEFKQTLGKEQSRQFVIGDARPTYYGPRGVVVLDPAAPKRTYDFFSTNHGAFKVQIYAVTPSDLKAYGFYLQNHWNHDDPPKLPGRKVFDGEIKPKDTPNELVETSLDLSKALSPDGFGHAIVHVEPTPWTEPYPPPDLTAWVQATSLGVDAHVDGDQLQAFVTELGGGKPAAGVVLTMMPSHTTATSDAQGLASIPLGASVKGTYYLLAKRGNDTAFVAEDADFDDYGSWYRQPRDRAVAWYVADDRKLYKPGEEVSLKGWLRIINYGKGGDVEDLAGKVTNVRYVVRDSRGNEIAKGSAPVNLVGGFDTKFTLPSTPNLGATAVTFTADGMGGNYYHQIQVEEFRRPEFEVSANASAGPFVVGGGGDVTVAAKYYAGGALPGAEVNWYVTTSSASFSPPNHDDYVFGNWEPWWGYHRWYDDDSGDGDGDDTKRAPSSYTHQAKTDAAGEHVLHLDFLSVKPAMPMTVTANATVMDVNRQAWTASSTMIVHPATLYAGIKTKRPFVDKGVPFDVDVIAVDLDGTAQPGTPVTLISTRLDWSYENGKYKTKEVDPQTCKIVAQSDAVPCSFKTAKGGTYQLVASVVDPKGRLNTTKLTYWVSGGDMQPPARTVEKELVTLIPDRKEYAPGNTAEIMLQAPFYPAEGIVSWRRSGIVKTERITIDGPTASLRVPIEDAMTPNLFVQVDLVGMALRTNHHGEPDPKLPKRPAYASGMIDLPIPPRQRTLQVTATPSTPKLAPGEQATIAVEVKDAAGKPVSGAETAIIVVDESVLALAAYTHPNPINSFYPQRGTDTRDYYEREYVQLANPETTRATSLPGGNQGGEMDGIAPAEPAPIQLEEAEAEGGGAGTGAAMSLDESKLGSKGDRADMPAPKAARAVAREKEATNDKSQVASQPATAVAVRTNFNALAAFSPSVITDVSGRATVTVKVPDNLTRYRVVALAAAGARQFGKGESAITARLPLMVRPSPPRFLNFGDAFELPVVVQNQTDTPMTVRVAARATNAAFTDGAGREVTVPANDRVEVRFPTKADMAGTARFQLVGAAGNYSDAANLELPVWTPATTEAFATYGVIDDGAIAQPIALPGKVWPQFGGLEITTASTNLQALTDAVIYLVHYPFECAEQRSSRIIAIESLRDVLTAFHAKDMPSVQEMESSIDKDLVRLKNMQNYDGGFTWWERGYPSDPYLSVFVMHALVKAQKAHAAETRQMLAQGRYYVENIESHIPGYYPEDVRTAIRAYALYVRKLEGDVDVAKAKALLAEHGGPDKLPMEANGWLLGTLAGRADAAAERAAIVRHAMNKVSETAGAANFTESYSDGAHLLLASDRRIDGIMLESLIQEQPKSDLIPKLVTGLLAHRKRGRWLNTQENAWVLMALELYFHTYEKTTPNFVARAWLGNDYAGDHTFRGRTTEYSEIDIAMKDVATHDQQNLTIQKDGAGRLYYRIGMKYAPEDLKLEPADYGFVVQRRYEGVDNPNDVTRDGSGVWHIKAGSRVRVHLDMVNENRRYHVALVDPLPAGLEPMNPALATTGPLPLDPNQDKSRGRYWWWYGPWYEHQNMRDERVEAFASMLWEGNHSYEYIARATTPGNFVVPPPKAEEMYMPETFGRGGSDRVIVE
jgi:uncharacterized protein YfaS (alpha-2-macroglobulin family)